MTQFVLDPAQAARFSELNEPVQVCDEAGRVLGEFRPATVSTGQPPEGMECPHSSQELQRRRENPVRFTTKQVLKHLESL